MVDMVLWRFYHQTLVEYLNEVYIRTFTPNDHPSMDEMFAIIQNGGALKSIADPNVKNLRDAVERMVKGTYGLCVECGQEIASELLEQNPTAQRCVHVLIQRFKELFLYHS